jgi:hypothetical protein
MSTGGDHGTVDGNAVKCPRPERWIRDVFANYIDTFVAGEAHNFCKQILTTIVDAEVGAVTFRQLDSFIGAGTGDDCCAQHFGHLNAAITQCPGSTHD